MPHDFYVKYLSDVHVKMYHKVLEIQNCLEFRRELNFEDIDLELIRYQGDWWKVQ